MENKDFEILKPVPQKIKFFSTGTFILLAFIVTGFTFGLARFILGLGSVTNLNNQYPWGIWIAIMLPVELLLQLVVLQLLLLWRYLVQENINHF